MDGVVGWLLAEGHTTALVLIIGVAGGFMFRAVNRRLDGIDGSLTKVDGRLDKNAEALADHEKECGERHEDTAAHRATVLAVLDGHTDTLKAHDARIRAVEKQNGCRS